MTYSHDALPAALCTDESAQYIRNALVRMSGLRSSSSVRYLIEKTCANTLRVPFVDTVLPDTRFVHIIRDGRDVTVSAHQQWQAETSFAARVKKALRTPASGLRAGIQHMLNQLRAVTDSRASSRSWGPHYPGMEDDQRALSLLEVCAQQWVHCVETCLSGLSDIPDDRQHTVRYESLVTSEAPVDDLLSFLELPDPDAVRSFYHRTVRQDSVGRWKRELTEADRSTLTPLLSSTLQRLGYTA
jgi:hypothetical protein